MMNDEVVLMKLKNLLQDKKNERERLRFQMEGVNAFIEGVQCSIDLIERERPRELKA
jgi:hypothetical protein